MSAFDERIDQYRRQDIDVKEVLGRVAIRGGPATAWRVDLDAGEARFEAMTVCFYRTSERGGFAANGYRGFEIETRRECDLMDDAYACIYDAIKKITL